MALTYCWQSAAMVVRHQLLFCRTIRCRAHSTAYSLRPHVLSSDANPFISCANHHGYRILMRMVYNWHILSVYNLADLRRQAHSDLAMQHRRPPPPPILPTILQHPCNA